MNSTTFVGNLTRDPELRHSQDGSPRASLSVAVNEGQGDNEKTHFVNVTAFGTLGENVAKSLKKGQRVVVVGRLDTYAKEVQVSGEDKKLTLTNFIASALGPDLRWATADVTRVTSNGGGAKASGNGGGNGNGGAAKPAAASKPAASDDEF